MNLIFPLYEGIGMGIHPNSFQDCLHCIKDIQEAFRKITEQETVSNASFSADENCFKLVRTYIQSDL